MLVYQFLSDVANWGGTGYFKLQVPAGHVTPVAEKPAEDEVINNGEVGTRNERNDEGRHVVTVDRAGSDDGDLMGFMGMNPDGVGAR